MKKSLRRLTPFVLTLLVIEFLDELVYGTREAAWPLIRDDLGLTYWQVGLLLGMPNVIASLIEPVIGILGDVWKRRALVLGGGIFFALAALLTAVSGNFWVFMLASIIFAPASGALVTLSQAALMDDEPERHEQNMARWTFAGSIGVVAGPLALGAAVWIGIGWRGMYTLFGMLTFLVVASAWRFRFPAGARDPEGSAPPEGETSPLWFRAGLRSALAALRRREVLRWLTLLEFSDLMLDVLLGFLALYMVDVVHVSPAQAGIAVAVWTGFGLLGDFLLIPLLERVRGLAYLRVSVLVELLLYPLFLIVPSLWAKLAVLALLGLFNSGWYAILQGKLYSSMPGQSGTVMTVGNIFGLWASLIPVGLGALGERWGLGTAMWALLLGPIVLFIGLPRGGRMKNGGETVEAGGEHTPD